MLCTPPMCYSLVQSRLRAALCVSARMRPNGLVVKSGRPPAARGKAGHCEPPAPGLAHAGGAQAGCLGDRRVGRRERDHGQARPGGGAGTRPEPAAQGAGGPGGGTGRRLGGLCRVRCGHAPGLGRLPGRTGRIAGPGSLPEHRAQEHRAACEDTAIVRADGESPRGCVAW